MHLISFREIEDSMFKKKKLILLLERHKRII